MKNLENKSSQTTGLGLRLVKIYIALAFFCWKLSCLYISGPDGLSFNFASSLWSRVIEAGYAIGVLVLVGHAVVRFKSRLYKGMTQNLIFAGLGLVFWLFGSGCSFAVVNSVGMLALLGINAGMSFFAWKAWRYFRTRAMVYLFWGYAINLVREIGMRYSVEANAQVVPGLGDTSRFWMMVNDFGWSALHAEWLLEFYWLGYIVSSVLIAAGMILLLRQLRSEIPQPVSPNTAKYVAAATLFLLIGLYPSLAVFGSPDFVTAIAVNAVIFSYSAAAYWKSKADAFALWVWASGITVLLTLVRQFHRSWIYPPREFDQLLLELLTVGSLVAGLLWMAGFVLAIRQLVAPPTSIKTTKEIAPQVVLFPKPPGWMKKRLVIIIGIGGLAVGIVWLSQNDPSQVFSLEPKYEGYTLSYWINPRGETVNAEAKTAIQSMGTKAVPYLVDWIGRSYSSYPNGNYPERALRGFEALGPVAKPAVPQLIKIIGQGDYPVRALLCIGPAAVPALADKYLETLAYTNPPMMNWRNPRYTTSPARIQESIVQTFSQMGTNAEAALPVLIKGVNSKTPWTRAEAALALGNIGQNQPDMIIPVLINVLTNANTDPISQGMIAWALASVGHERPKVVIPVLIQTFTNLNTSAIQTMASRGELPFRPDIYFWASNPSSYDLITHPLVGVVDALAFFGGEAKAAIPCLLLAGQSEDATLRDHAAVAIQKIAPETPAPLAPLIRNLTEPDVQVRQQALQTLESLGTNAVEALPTLTQKCLHDSDIEVRKSAMRCISNIGQFNEEVIAALGDNAICTNDYVGQQAVSTIYSFANRSKLAFLELAKAMFDSPVYNVKEDAKNLLEMLLRNDPDMLVQCLEDTNSQTRYQGLRIVDAFGANIPDLTQTLPVLKQALRDDSPEARVFATNMLIRVESKSYGSQVAELLVRGGNLNATNEQGQTIMHFLIASRDPHRTEAIAALLGAGANPNIKDKLGRTPAHLLLTTGWPWEGVGDLFSLLVNGGADLSVADNNGRTPLHYLAAMGNENPLFFIHGIGDIFAAAKVDFQARDNDGNTPLHVAVKAGTQDVYGWLIQHGASLDATNNAGQTPRQMAIKSTDPFAQFRSNPDTDIYQAIREGKIESVSAILRSEPDLLNKTNLFGQTPLLTAIQANRTNIVEFLIQHGAEWDIVSAVEVGRADMVRNLLGQKPDSITNGFAEATLLQLAASQGVPEAVLLQLAASRSLPKATLLHLAASRDQVAVAEVLLSAGADVTAKNPVGISPLGSALAGQHTDMAGLLRAHGATENIFDATLLGHLDAAKMLIAGNKSLVSATNTARIPLTALAIASGHMDILKLLLDNGAPLDSPNGTALLHLTAVCNQSDAVPLLIQHGAKVDAFDENGFTALHLAAIHGSTEVAAVLLKNGAMPDVPVTSPPNQAARAAVPMMSRSGAFAGDTALHLAALAAQTNIVELLLRAGASVNANNAVRMTPLDMPLQIGLLPHIYLRVHYQYLFSEIPGLPKAILSKPLLLPSPAMQQLTIALLEKAGAKHGANPRSNGMPVRFN